jgi:hypothetical protein
MVLAVIAANLWFFAELLLAYGRLAAAAYLLAWTVGVFVIALHGTGRTPPGPRP